MSRGKKDLQQCADACMRLYAEFLYSKDQFDEISFTFTSGDIARYNYWADGYRPLITGDEVVWDKTAMQ